uniref:Phage-related DNA maturase n=1 Tax=uncultured marine virus TaxID=186617 RepID=A0A0F7LBK8_9VIRU|nr:phage-related DNA maturase [uncultured marine virus]
MILSSFCLLCLTSSTEQGYKVNSSGLSSSWNIPSPKLDSTMILFTLLSFAMLTSSLRVCSSYPPFRPPA